MVDTSTAGNLGDLDTGIEGLSGGSAGSTGSGDGDPFAAGVNSAPVVLDDDAGVAVAGASLVIDPADLLANDSDADGDALVLDGVGGASNGTVDLGADGTISYTPDAGFTGEDSFSYTVSDGNGGMSTAEVSVTVEAPDAPADVASFNQAQVIDLASADGAAARQPSAARRLAPAR